MTKKLRTIEKEFCKLIIEMLQCNPYHHDREAINNKIAGWDWGKFGDGWAKKSPSVPQLLKDHIFAYQPDNGLVEPEKIWESSRTIDQALLKIAQYKEHLEPNPDNPLKPCDYSSEDKIIDNVDQPQRYSSYESIENLLLCYIFHLSVMPFYALIEKYENFHKAVEKKLKYEIESIVLGRAPHKTGDLNTEKKAKIRAQLFHQQESTLNLVLIGDNKSIEEYLQTGRKEDPEKIELKDLIKTLKKKIAVHYNLIQSLLKDHGFKKEDFSKLFSIFFQLCRAYYFIRKEIKGEHESIRLLKQKIWDSIITKDLLLYKDKLCDKMADFFVLILGDTGTGKSAIANVIGQSGYIEFDEEKKVFVENFKWHYRNFNLSSLSDNLIEAELFGHAEGAFTGAYYDKKGLFELSGSHGTIFLDEIGELSERNQVLLLKVLQEREFFRVGEPQLPRRFKGRTICATNRKLDVLREEEAFRNDLYFRISTIVIEAPCLKDMIYKQDGSIDFSENGELFRLVSDILWENFGRASHFPEKIPEDENIRRCREAVLSQIDKLPKNYPWDGNFRELQQCIKQVLSTGEYQGDPLQLVKKDSVFKKIPTNKDELDYFTCQVYKFYYDKCRDYKAVGKIFGLDWRTVKRHIKLLDHSSI